MKQKIFVPDGMRNLLGYGLAALAVLVVLTMLAVPPSKYILEQWLRADVESRARLVYSSVQGPVRRALAAQDQARLSSILEGIAEDERVLAVGLCNADGVMSSATKLMPADFSCEGAARSEGESYASIVHDGGGFWLRPSQSRPRAGRFISRYCTISPSSTGDRGSCSCTSLQQFSGWAC